MNILETGSAFPYNPTSKSPCLSLPQFSETGSQELRTHNQTPIINISSNEISGYKWQNSALILPVDTNVCLYSMRSLTPIFSDWKLRALNPKPRFLFINLVIVEGTKSGRILETMTWFAIILPVDTHVCLYSMRSKPLNLNLNPNPKFHNQHHTRWNFSKKWQISRELLDCRPHILYNPLPQSRGTRNSWTLNPDSETPPQWLLDMQ